jgi:thiol-disulfide isomerase/thioredoxin
MTRRSLLLSVAVLTACSGAAPRPETAGPTLSPIPSTVSLRMSLARLNGGRVSLDAHRGKPVLLTLFTTWCLPCQEDAPSFARLHDRFGSRGLVVLGIALNNQGATPIKLVKLYAEEMGFRFDVLLASPEDLELVGAVGKTPLLPRTVLLDREGRAVLDQIGYTDFQVLEKKILELLSTRPQKKVTISLSARLLSEAHLLFVLGRAFTARPPRRSESAGAPPHLLRGPGVLPSFDHFLLGSCT